MFLSTFLRFSFSLCLLFLPFLSLFDYVFVLLSIYFIPVFVSLYLPYFHPFCLCLCFFIHFLSLIIFFLRYFLTYFLKIIGAIFCAVIINKQFIHLSPSTVLVLAFVPLLFVFPFVVT
jgi:hypothetical protein